MDKLIQKLKGGHKICLEQLSPLCLKLSSKDNFVGHFCRECHNTKMREYYKKYQRKSKVIKEKIFGDLTLNNKELDEIDRICDDDKSESERSPESPNKDQGKYDDLPDYDPDNRDLVYNYIYKMAGKR